MAITDSNRTDDNDNIIITVGESESGETLNLKPQTGTGYNAIPVIGEKLLPVTPGDRVVHISEFLRNGSNASMDVNGATTSQTFSWTVPTGEIWYATGLTLMFYDNGTNDFNEFGTLAALANGLLIEIILDSTTYQLENLQNNHELFMAFSDNAYLWPQSSSFLDDSEIFAGQKFFKPNIVMQENDQIRATVRDNLSGLNELKLKIEKWRVLP